MKVRDVIQKIEADGWRLDRTRGSHRIYKHPTKTGTVVVAGLPSKDLAIGTLKSIFSQAELQQP